MKITGVKSTLYAHRLNRRMGDANSPSGRVKGANCVVELETDEGLTGIGLGGGGVRPQIQALVEGLLKGQDPRRGYGLWQRMVDKHFKGGHDGLINDAISVLDMALWDLKAKAKDEPLWKTLGGSRDRALCYASGIEAPLSDQQVHDWYAQMATQYGFKGGKLKVGLDQDADLRRLGLMDQALRQVADRPMLLIDANEYWSPKQAIRKVRQMEERFDLTWVEEPARRWDFLGLKRVSDSVRSPVCAGENLDTLGDFLPYFHHRCADVIQVSYGMTGITCALQLADAAYGYELPVTLGGSPGNIHAHLATVMPNFMCMEVVDPEPGDGVFNSDIKIVDGWAIPDERPGLGIEIDREALARQAVDRVPPGAGPSPFGRRQGAGLYEVPPSAAEQAEAAKGGED
ncbi:MAG: mandelate racemase/muconate lactonizing enzyme family protein [Candidatus Latescibacteria bacterium]|nr:mandelate racemase/muconate lactonizing enzyme family protein [Candidatus Latescibacterota bacterium]